MPARLPLLLVGLQLACGAAPDLLAPGDPPFTADQIRAATPEGRQYRYRIEQPGKPPFIQIIELVDVDADGATLRQRSVAADAEPENDAPDAAPGPASQAPDQSAAARVSWATLEGHGRSPAAATRVHAEKITVPAGTFDCLRYTIRKGEQVTRSWFARALPGAPIQQEVVHGKIRAFRMVLLAHHPAPPDL